MAIDYDGLIDKYFLRQPDGRSIYRPWGVLGRSYWVASVEDGRRMTMLLRRRLKVARVVLPIWIVLLLALYDSSVPYHRTLLALMSAAVFLWWGWGDIGILRGLERAPRVTVAAGGGGRMTRWLDSMAAGQSFTAYALQLLVLGPVAVYAVRDLGRAWPPTVSGIFGDFVLCSLVLVSLAGLITKIRKRATLGGPSPEQQYAKAIRRPVWIFLAALCLLAVVGGVVLHQRKASDESRPEKGASQTAVNGASR